MLFLHDLALPSKKNPKTQTRLHEDSYNVRLGRCHHSHIIMPYIILENSHLQVPIQFDTTSHCTSKPVCLFVELLDEQNHAKSCSGKSPFLWKGLGHDWPTNRMSSWTSLEVFRRIQCSYGPHWSILFIRSLLQYVDLFIVCLPWVTPWLSHQRSPGMELLHSVARWCPPVLEQELGINFYKATVWHKTSQNVFSMNVE